MLILKEKHIRFDQSLFAGLDENCCMCAFRLNAFCGFRGTLVEPDKLWVMQAPGFDKEKESVEFEKKDKFSASECYRPSVGCIDLNHKKHVHFESDIVIGAQC